jgi:flagellar biosynthesis protein FlhG
MSRAPSTNLAEAVADGREAMVIVIASGKGGVGKSVLAVLLADRLARDGCRVLLLDGAQNLGHLHVLLGVAGDHRLEQVQRGEVEPADLLVPIREGLVLLPGDSGSEGLYALPNLDQARLHHRLSALYRGFDLVVVDAGPGVEGAIRLATMGGTRLVVVTAAEIGALTDGYALIKLVHAQLPSIPIDVVVNRVEVPGEGEQAFERLAVAAERFLGKSLGWLGELPEAPALREAVRRPGAILDDHGMAALGIHLDRLAEQLTQPYGGAGPTTPVQGLSR